MTWVAAITTGFGLGLASFGALWLTVRQVVFRQQGRMLVGVSSLLRLCLVGLAFYALSQQGADKLLAGLAGFWLARGSLSWRLGGVQHGE